MRLVVAREARPSSSRARRHCSSSPSRSPSFSRNACSAEPESLPASAKTRIFSSIDHAFDLCRRGRISGKLCASPSHRDNVCCGIPISSAKALALTESRPVNRSIIFCLNANENDFVIVLSVLAPHEERDRSDNYAGARGAADG
jgi:hypothetical protein